MKKSTIAIVGIGAAIGLYVLSRKVGSSESGGSGSMGGGSSQEAVSGGLGGLLDSALGSISNIGASGESLTGSMAGITQALENMMRGLSDASVAMSNTMVTMANTGTKGAETIQNVVSVPHAFSKTFSNAGTNIAQFLNNLPTYATKTDLTKPFDALSRKTTKSGLKGQANAGDAVKNFLSGKWW